MAPVVDPSSRIALRHEPPALGAGVVARSRLVAPLRGRFERRLTVVTAGAGFGKTTLLAQAVAENRLEQWGVDAWLRVDPADRDPFHLLGALSQSLTGTAVSWAVSVEELADQVWSHAPTPVALIVDDAHLLGDGTGDGAAAWQALSDLLARLPANGHLVVAGRTRPALPTAKLQLDGDALVIDEDALGFTEDEATAFGQARGLVDDVSDPVASWPALAVLQSSIGRSAGASFVWEEVLAPLTAARLRLLALVAPFDVVDDLLVSALDPTVPLHAADLVEGLPLVQSDGQGSFRLHALFREVLAERISAPERTAALARAAATLVDAGADRLAIEAAAAAGDEATLHRAVCQYFIRPIRMINVPDVVAIYQRLPARLLNTPLGCFVDAARHWQSSAGQAIARFERAEAEARQAGDDKVEALAAWRLVQLRYLEDHDLLVPDPRHDDLAASGVPLARSTPAFIRSVRAQDRGDVDAAITALDDLDDVDLEQRNETVAVRMFDLGRPEALPATLDSLLASDPIDLFAAQALWTRGEVPPEAAWLVARGLAEAGGRAGVLHEEVSVRTIVATVALVVGEDDAAEELMARVRAIDGLVGAHVRLLSAVTDALLALSTTGEADAVARLAAALDDVPVGAWPARPWFYALAPLRALLPDRCDHLDQLDLGPSLRTAVEAGAALAVLRADGDTTPAARLPWHRPDLLRVHVPPPLLAELALAAQVGGSTAAPDVFALLPHPRRWLERIAAHPAAPASLRAVADERLAALPARPRYAVDLRVLGPLRIHRSDGQPVDDARTSRARVRQLLARLVLQRRVSRAGLAQSMWPDLPLDKALTNLRVNLRHLQVALQPEREAGGPPWFVQSDQEWIWLADEGLTVDLWRFDLHVGRAVAAEADGLPSQALVELRAASDLYEGDLFERVEDLEVELERARVRALALSTRCRVGELVLARGEPEAAMADAVHALRLDGLSERANRLFIRCQLAVGATSVARDRLDALVADLDAEGLRPEPETLALRERISPAAR